MPPPPPLLLDDIPASESRFTLGPCIGDGIRASVYEATDASANNRKVAIKVQRLTADNEECIREELRVLKELAVHPNIPEFYGIFKKGNGDNMEIWMVMELCEGGSVMDIVRGLNNKNRRMAEEHIAFILKETVKALVHLHANNTIHRAITADNILLTKTGEVKLVDFGLSRDLTTADGKRNTCIGGAYWLAPEMVACSQGAALGYGSKADVWALGITAVELGDAMPPLHGMHPTRVMFQVVRNPPPGLQRPACWSEQYNDFVAECLEKNPEYRPYMEELLEHPFLTNIPENCHYLTQELKKIHEDLSKDEKHPRLPEAIVKNNMMQTGKDLAPVKMIMEDLAAIEDITEDGLISELKERFSEGNFHTFVGDVLLVLNPNEIRDIYGDKHHIRYTLKSRSVNPPHIYTLADRAYQDALHHESPQHVLLAGETSSGKTTALRHLVRHLLHLGRSKASVGDSVEKALEVVMAFTNASTMSNVDSTRCVMRVGVTFGASGKVSGMGANVGLLEKWRVSSTDLSQSNFHILYYFYDYMQSTDQLSRYLLDEDRTNRYLRIPTEESSNPNETRNNPEENCKKFSTILSHLQSFKLTQSQLEVINKTLAAILNLGEIHFTENEDSTAEMENPEVCANVAELLNLNKKKLIWSLTNYCLVDQGTAVKKQNDCDQARDARDMLANCLYSRLVDWIVNLLNNKMAKKKAIYGDKYVVNIYDYFGFECFKRNDLEQLLVNTFNEQIQYLYINRVFTWEIMELIEDDITPPSLNFYNNKRGVDHLLGKPAGVLSLIDAASKTGHGFEHILDSIQKSNKSPFMDTTGDKEFYFSHYTGKITYDIREMSQKNRDFLSPDIIETLRQSSNQIIRELFTNKLSKSGNLICDNLNCNRWNSALIAEQDKPKKFDCLQTQYSQTKHMRTAITTFRSVSLEILRELSVGAGSGGNHFIRCIRTDLTGSPRGFQQELVKQQLRALSVLDTAKARQLGYPHRITFPEFIRRYKFLAFDFDENVDITQDNCRLLLIRLKMEGWIIGKSKVFLKYYHEEYLSRLYETQVKKIIKIQSMMRAFLAKRNVASKIRKMHIKTGANLIRRKTSELGAEAAAALMIQKAYRGYNVRKKFSPLVNNDSGQLDIETANFIRPFFTKWKKKSIFQVLLQYRSARFQDLINLSQQIHIFNQNTMHEIQQCNDAIDIEKVDPTAKSDLWLGEKKPSVWKLPFHFDEIPYYDTEHMCDTSATPDENQETWDSPLEWRRAIINELKDKDYTKTTNPSLNIQPTPTDELLINMPFTRDPSSPIPNLPKLNLESPLIKTTTPINANQSELPKNKVIGRIQTPASQIIISPKKIRPQSITNVDKNFEGANQDFEFIRSPVSPVNKLKRRPGNPIAELESMGRKMITEKANEDEPPFNFQGMLRKTNYNRGSIKQIQEKKEELPYTKVLKNKVNKEHFEVTKTEIWPGIILQGIVTDL